MQQLARDGYTSEQIKKALHSSNRRISFRYELLDKFNKFKAHLTNVLDGSIENNALAQIKGTARFIIKDTDNIDFLSDRIKPYYRLWMGNSWVEWPLGVFLLSTPPRKTDEIGVVIREVEAYDQLQVLVDDKVENRYTIPAGANYIIEVKTLLTSAGITMQNLTATDKALPVTKDWPPGTPKLKIINELLDAINYESLWFDENGYAVARPYFSPSQRASEYTYRDDQDSVIFPAVQQHLDLFNKPNKFIAMVSESDRPTLLSVYTNNNPDSPLSTVSRGRVITAEPVTVDVVDQTTLDAYVQRMADEESQVFEEVEMKSAIMPMHSNADVITVEFSKLGIADKYSEHVWSFNLEAGAEMVHRIRKVVNL